MLHLLGHAFWTFLEGAWTYYLLKTGDSLRQLNR